MVSPLFPPQKFSWFFRPVLYQNLSSSMARFIASANPEICPVPPHPTLEPVAIVGRLTVGDWGALEWRGLKYKKTYPYRGWPRGPFLIMAINWENQARVFFQIQNIGLSNVTLIPKSWRWKNALLGFWVAINCDKKDAGCAEGENGIRLFFNPFFL